MLNKPREVIKDGGPSVKNTIVKSGANHYSINHHSVIE